MIYISQVVTSLAACADRHDLAGFMGLFDEDPILVFAGRSFRGHGPISKLMEERFAAVTTVHHCSTPCVHLENGKMATSQSSALIFEWEVGAGRPEALVAKRVVQYRDDLTYSHGIWKVARREITATPIARGE